MSKKTVYSKKNFHVDKVQIYITGCFQFATKYRIFEPVYYNKGGGVAWCATRIFPDLYSAKIYVQKKIKLDNI